VISAERGCCAAEIRLRAEYDAEEMLEVTRRNAAPARMSRTRPLSPLFLSLAVNDSPLVIYGPLIRGRVKVGIIKL